MGVVTLGTTTKRVLIVAALGDSIGAAGGCRIGIVKGTYLLLRGTTSLGLRVVALLGLRAIPLVVKTDGRVACTVASQGIEAPVSTS